MVPFRSHHSDAYSNAMSSPVYNSFVILTPIYEQTSFLEVYDPVRWGMKGRCPFKDPGAYWIRSINIETTDKVMEAFV
ncbi:hypothetical protein SAY87_012956 [Trapa incisa]|uniref:Uncharacterized protein n=1 Tax=Trapa incisa TaxID=236973 RepID=A0AAN7QCN1_9MYRT|nr:hypothetical protein SAY87_012956 [Trapa incisa]